MRMRQGVLVIASLWGMAGCDDNSEHPNPVVTDLAVAQDMAGPQGQADGLVPESMSRIRFGNLTPDASPIDVCIAPAGTSSFIGNGPLLAAHGLPGGVSYGNIAFYIDVPAGTVTVRVIAGGATSCATGIIPDVTGVGLPGSTSLTLVLIGETAAAATHPLALARYIDDSAATSSLALFRVVHTAPQVGPINAGTLNAGVFTTLFSNVAYPQAGSGSGVDANGYLSAAPFADGTVLGLQTSANGTVVTLATTLANPPGVPAGGIRTAFVIGGNTTAPIQPLQVLLCGDNIGPAQSNSALANCIATPLAAQ